MTNEAPSTSAGRREKKETEALTASAIQEGTLCAFAHSTNANETLTMDPCYRVKGCDHVVWSVGSHVLHALPASAKNAKSLQRDRAVTLLLRRYSTISHAISAPPEPFRIGGWICTLQERLPGSLLEACLEARSSDKTVQGVIDLLKTLRSVPREQAMEIVYYEQERPNLKKRVTKALRHLDVLHAIGYIPEISQLKPILSLAALQALRPTTPYEPVLLHGDISMQHILVDDSDGTITGVIDWSDAMLGDPCEEIAGVALSLGARKAKRIAAEVRYDEYTIERGLLFAKCLAIEDLRELKLGEEEVPPEALLKAQFRMAFEDMDLGGGYVFQ